MDSDSDYMTTYSQDERIEAYLAEKRLAEEEERKKEDLERSVSFQEYYEEYKNNEESVLTYAGLTFLKFCHTKIKFTFQPFKIARVSQTIIFYCTIRYANGHWRLRRDTFPANYKERIYNLFYTKNGFAIDDGNILQLIHSIYAYLLEWTQEHEHFRRERYQSYLNGEDIILDADEEELFLNEDEIEEIHRKREAILSRMIDPNWRE